MSDPANRRLRFNLASRGRLDVINRHRPTVIHDALRILLCMDWCGKRLIYSIFCVLLIGNVFDEEHFPFIRKPRARQAPITRKELPEPERSPAIILDVRFPLSVGLLFPSLDFSSSAD